MTRSVSLPQFNFGRVADVERVRMTRGLGVVGLVRAILNALDLLELAAQLVPGQGRVMLRLRAVWI